jgi:hypothetical protein
MPASVKKGRPPQTAVFYLLGQKHEVPQCPQSSPLIKLDKYLEECKNDEKTWASIGVIEHRDDFLPYRPQR